MGSINHTHVAYEKIHCFCLIPAKVVMCGVCIYYTVTQKLVDSLA